MDYQHPHYSMSNYAPSPYQQFDQQAQPMSRKRGTGEYDGFSDPAKRAPVHNDAQQFMHHQTPQWGTPWIMDPAMQIYGAGQVMQMQPNYFYNPHQPSNQHFAPAPAPPPQQHNYHQLDYSSRVTPPMSTNHQFKDLKTPAMPTTQLPSTFLLTPESDDESGDEEVENAWSAESLARDRYNSKKECEPATSYATFGEPDTLEGAKVVDTVDGRLPTVSERARYNLTVDELRRRIGAPEFMNYSSLYCFFRKSKKKNGLNEVRNSLETNSIVVERMQRQKKPTCFSSMLEEEAVRLADDIDKLYQQYFPFAPVSRAMIDAFFAQGMTVEQVIQVLKDTARVIERVIKTLKDRQPKVTGKEERLKNNQLDLPYHVFSLTTHGFGHPSSLTHYDTYLKIVNHAALICEDIQRGVMLQPLRQLAPGQEPWLAAEHKALI